MKSYSVSIQVDAALQQYLACGAVIMLYKVVLTFAVCA